ncbi:MAG: translation elongation factor 4 [Patescibacteria group bacterium]
MKNIRNFAIISHIDHGKSTLADRFLELTKTVAAREMREQFLDQMELEREKGITIKLAPVRMEYEVKISNFQFRISNQILNPKSQNSKFILNLIDTPGHADFQYEVSRSLACCEGVILLVDATQGIQAQTLSNLYAAIENNLEIIPVINKIDLPNAEVEKTKQEIKSLLGCREEEIICISAKLGTNCEKVLEAVVERIPPPSQEKDQFRALIFDSIYSDFQGVIAYVRVFDCEIKSFDKVKFFNTDREIEIQEVGYFKPKRIKTEKLQAGEIGYIVTGLKEIRECRVGDTIAAIDAKESLSGYKKVKPIVFANFYPESANDFMVLRESLEKLQLNDAALSSEPKSTPALGRGFTCGFLGLLHLEIISERLKREFGLKLVITTPSVSYKILLSSNKEKTIYNPQDLPDPSQICEIKEPWVKLDIISPANFIGQVMDLIKIYRGKYVSTEYLASAVQQRLILHYEMPLSSLISDFYDKLKSVTSGFASVNYELLDYRLADLVKLEILVAGDKVDAFSRIVPHPEAYQQGKNLVNRLKEVIPAQNFPVALQAVVGGKILARQTIKALRKDVLAKLYGGDVTRKMKLLEKQKRGKKELLKKGKIKIPQRVYLEVLKK